VQESPWAHVRFRVYDLGLRPTVSDGRPHSKVKVQKEGDYGLSGQTFAACTILIALHEAAPCLEGSLPALEGSTQAHTTAFAGTSSLPQI
jgi:hypothetical protein